MANLKVSEQAYPSTRYTEGAAPSTPASGEVIVYAKAAGLMYSKDDAGTETALGGGSGAVATDAIWDAAGDLVVGTGANTAAKLTKGSDGTVLTVTAGAVGWAAPAGGAPTFVGAKASRTTDQTGVVTVTATPVVYNGTELFDTHGFHDTSTNPSRMTIPSGKDGKYLVIGSVVFDSSGAGVIRDAFIFKNGTHGTINQGTFVRRGPQAYASIVISDILNLVAGDYVEIAGQHDIGSNGTFSGSVIPMFFSIQWLGA